MNHHRGAVSVHHVANDHDVREFPCHCAANEVAWFVILFFLCHRNRPTFPLKIGLQIELTQTQTIIASKGPITVYCCNNRTPILPLPYLHNEIRGLQTDSFLNLYYIYLLKATSCDSNLTYSDWRPHVSCLHLSSGVLNQFLNRSSGEDMFSCF